MTSILEIEDMTKSYRNKRGIQNIRMHLNQGDIYGLLGPNGAGKTTLLKTITGLAKANKGKITLFGQDIDQHGGAVLRRVGCMIESADFYDYVTAYQYLKLIAQFYSTLTEQHIRDAIQTVGLEPYGDSRVKYFSTGMKQRLALAAAILPQPDLVILDEPTNGLDVEGIVWFRQLVRTLASQHNITFLLSSHMIHELETLCNRVGIIYDGRLVIEGSVSELLQDNQTLEQYYMDQLGRAREGSGK